MSFPRHEKYKDSGVEWLGELPEHWSIEKFRYCFRESPEKIENEVVGEMLSVSGYRGIEIKEYDDENRRRTDEDLIGYRIVRKGQLVVNTMWLNYAGLGVSSFEGHVSPAYRSYWIADNLNKRFIHYLLRSSLYVNGYTKYLTGIRPNSLQMSRDDLMAFPILIPSQHEQYTIAAFLDRETAKIDALIAEQQRLIELLKEKRQAIISHAVTKGLNPDAPMKDSGIAWMGWVAEHWSLPKIRYVARVENGTTPSRNNLDYWMDGDIPWLSSGEVNQYAVTEASEHITSLALRECSLRLLPRGTIIVGLIGQGKTRGLSAQLEIEATINQNLAAIIPDQSLSPKYLHYILQAAYEYLREYGRGGQQAALNCEILADMRLPLPPLDEQLLISATLDEQTANLDALTAEAQRAITLLQERRTALISAAVTGKIDVRGLVTAQSTVEAAA
ncbi:restriction endonuclease subunit S [Methylocaldum sp. 14B]|uniref:restriction endonuclease subunit S n=1 Tax=Methylocaldum sp. 14B TaxID=1912213 RepID=UPI00098A792D|nr:restriction endonuclease subunit S [Methylocaldum sp. 14B]